MDTIIDWSLKMVLGWLKFMLYGSFVIVCVSITFVVFVSIFLKNLSKNW